MLFLCQVLNTIKMCVSVGMHRNVIFFFFFKCQFSVSSMSVAMLSSIVYGKVSCHILVQCNLYASHVEKSVSGHDALQFVCLTYIWKRCLMSRSIAVCMYYMQKSVPSHLGALQFVCLTYGKCVCYVTIHCNLHASHMENVPVMSQYIAICMHYMQKRVPSHLDALQFVCLTYGKGVLYHNTLPFVCLTYGKGVCCHNTLQFACIIYRKVSCYVWIHCSLYASHVEKVSVTSQYIAICVPHIWKKCLSCDVYQFACSSIWHYGGGGGGQCYITVHCNLHALYTEKCLIMSGYIAVCIHHLWKGVCYVSLRPSLYTSHMEKVSVMWCIAICMQFYLAWGGHCYITIHCNLHASDTKKIVMSERIAVCMPHMENASVMWCIAICMQFSMALGWEGGGGGDSAEPPVRNVGVLGELSGGNRSRADASHWLGVDCFGVQMVPVDLWSGGGEWGLRVCGFTGTFIGGVGCSFWHFKRVCVLGGGRRGGVNVCSPLALLDGGGGVGEYYWPCIYICVPSKSYHRQLKVFAVV